MFGSVWKTNLRNSANLRKEGITKAANIALPRPAEIMENPILPLGLLPIPHLKVKYFF